MFQASLSCSHLLLSSGTNGGGRRHVTVMDMLQSGRTLMALATLLLAPVPLEEVIVLVFSQLLIFVVQSQL